MLETTTTDPGFDDDWDSQSDQSQLDWKSYRLWAFIKAKTNECYLLTPVTRNDVGTSTWYGWSSYLKKKTLKNSLSDVDVAFCSDFDELRASVAFYRGK